MGCRASLNHIYRLVWSKVLNTWIAVSETTRGRGKKTSRKLIAAALALCAAPALAAPAGGQVTAGTGSITQSGTTTTINQSSQNLSLSWKSFNTSANETVNFAQPSASAIAVNRIYDTNGTQFYGHLNANGQVYLINPNGVLFGAGSQVNVGGLVASTLDVSDSSLANAARSFSGNGTGSVVNQGTINGGYVAFLGNTVSNQGTITANGGAAALGAGSAVTLTFAGNNLVQMQVDQSTLNNLAENGGLIQADGGMVIMSAGAKNSLLASVVNNSGVIEARSVQNVNGSIVLDGGGSSTTNNSGTLDASGKIAGGTGGTVKVLGNTVNLAAGSNIDVSGNAGGGTALVGGNFHGTGPEQNAQTTTVATGTTINADAINNGNGGNVAVWSDVHTTVDGAISARGGANGGNGGQVETSGHKLTIGSNTRVSTLAPLGVAGDWLLDPTDFTIGDVGTVPGDILDTTLQTNLNAGNVTILSSSGGSGTNGDIIVDGVVYPTANTTLTLSAYRNITFSANGVTLDYSGSTSGSLVLRADNTGTGIGTVDIFGNNPANYVASGASGMISIYYNPTSYATPYDYATANTTAVGAGWGNMTPYMLVHINNASATAQNKTYDATTTASLNTAFTLSTTTAAGTPTGASLTAGTATFSDKNVATGKAVTFSGYSVSGTNAGQSYFLAAQPASQTANITAASLSVTGVTASNKTYDATTAATLGGTAAVTALGADVVSVGGTGSGTFANKNVGTGKAVTVTGFTLGGADAGNYTIVQPSGVTANITAANLSVTGVTAANKTYDATTAATLGGTAAISALGTDVVTLGGTGSGTFANKNVGTGKAVTVTGYTISGTDAGNYTLVQPAGVTANITAASLSVTGVTASNKTYDGATTATLGGTAAVTALGADVVSVGGTGSGTFANKNVGTGKAVTVTGFTLGGADAGNYTIVQPTGLMANITAKSVVLTAPSVSKTYDGGLTYTTTAGNLTSLAAGLVGGDTVSAATISYTNKNAGTGNKTVTLDAATISDGNGGANYSVTLAGNSTSTITAKAVTLTAPNVSKVYDAGLTYTTTAGDLTSLAAGLVGGDTVSAATIAYTNKNVGAGNKTVTLNAATISDGNGGANYSVTLAGNSTSTITAAPLTLSGITASNKSYDGTTSATLNTGGVTFSGLLGADVVTLGGTGVGTFSDKNAATGKTVTVSGYTLGGADAGNYAVAQPSGLTADITPAALTATITASNKVYDGTTAATPTFTITGGLIGTETVTASGTATFADKNVGTGKTVTANSVVLTNGTNGGLASNYSLTAGQTTTANITPAAITISGISASNKVYDATTAATINTAGATLSGKVAGDTVTISATGTFADANAGTGKTVTLVSSHGGADAGNYTFTDQASTTANITPATLTVTANNASKTYDGLAYSGGNGVTYTGFQGADNAASALTGTLAYGGSSQGATAAGSYLITPSGLSGTNYTPTFTDGTLTINAVPTVAATPQSTQSTTTQNTVTLVQTTVQPPQASTQPQVMNTSPTITVKQGDDSQDQKQDKENAPPPIQVNTILNLNGTGPTLQIVDGGMKLPNGQNGTTDSKEQL